MSCDLTCLCIVQNGFTALMFTANQGHQECLLILLAHGAEVDTATGVSVCGVYAIVDYCP